MTSKKRIGIIGAGISGLVTAKTCLEYGHEVIVFEKEAELGGVWAPSRRYPGLATQNTKDTYFFSDFPMPDEFPEWPTGENMQSYLKAYARTFKVEDHVRYNHDVTRVDFVNDQWYVAGTNDERAFDEVVDFLIVCNGTFSDPNPPAIPGQQLFLDSGGKIMHSSQFTNDELSKGLRTVVVGYGKSATDVVTAASNTAASCHLLFREAKWKIPRFIRGINSKYLFLNRLGEAMVKLDKRSFGERLLHGTGIPKLIISLVEKHLAKKQKLRASGLLPSSGIMDQVLFGEIAVETPEFFERVSQGRILTTRAGIEFFGDRKVILTTGETLECDLVIFATGFKQTISFLPSRLIARFTDLYGNYLLYKHIMPPYVPALAFVGYNSHLFSSLTSEIAALWLCEYLAENVRVPDDSEMLVHAKEFVQWKQSFRELSRGMSTPPYSVHHIEELLKDMHTSLPIRSLIADWFVIVNPARYHDIRLQLRNRRKSSHASVNKQYR